MSVMVRGYKKTGWGSWVIKWFTFGSYSHVSLIFNMGKPIEIEAIQGKGVIAHHPTESGEWDEYEVPITQEQAISAQNIAHNLLGAKYDWRGIRSFIRRKDRNNPSNWFCSELVAYTLMSVGYPLSRREPYRETPDSVMCSLRLIERPKEEGGA